MPIAKYDLIGGRVPRYLTINLTTGIITYDGDPALDYETTTSYTLVVKVTDVEQLTAQATVTVNITNVADVDPVVDDQEFGIAENSPNNTLVGTIR